MKFYCRRYKLKNDPDLIFKVREKEYNTPSLHLEPEEDANWYWLDAVPFVEETSKYSNAPVSHVIKY